jgi:hypothetical protein
MPRPQRQILVIAGFVGTALVGMVGLYASSNRHTSSSIEKPPPDVATVETTHAKDATDVRADTKHPPIDLSEATISTIQQRLEPLARRHDLKSATALSRAAMRCYKTGSSILRLQLQMKDLRSPSDFVPPQQRNDETAQRRIAEIEEFDQTHCASLSREDLTTLAKNAAITAAALGDADAQLCVIEQRFLEVRAFSQQPKVVADPSPYIHDYQQRALDRGDWRIVELMLARTLSRGHGPISARADMEPGDPKTFLGALQLLRLGATGDYAASLDEDIATFLETTNPALIAEGRGLSDDQIAEAAAWANDEFESHFSTSPPLTETPIACGDI